MGKTHHRYHFIPAKDLLSIQHWIPAVSLLGYPQLTISDHIASQQTCHTFMSATHLNDLSSPPFCYPYCSTKIFIQNYTSIVCPTGPALCTYKITYTHFRTKIMYFPGARTKEVSFKTHFYAINQPNMSKRSVIQT